MGLIKALGIGVPILVVLAIIGGLAFVIYRTRYITAKSNKTMVISGTKLGKGINVFTDEEGRSMKVLRGGGHFLRPNQTAEEVDLTSFQLKLTTPKVYTKGGVPIVADAVATVTVAGTLRGIAIYAEQFLGKKPKEIESEISEVLGANLRAILSKLTVEDINENRDSFSEQVKEIAQKQLDDMGFYITSLGLTDLRDADPTNGYLENMGRPLIAEARQRAETAEADSDKATRIFKANADKEAQEEEILRQTEIAESQKAKSLKEEAIREETGRAKAKAEQSYELEKTKLSKQVQEEDLKILAYKKEEELRISQLEKERQVKLEEEQSKIRKAKADADYYETTRVAEASAKKSEIDGLAQAKIKRETGLAEAEVIRRRGEAEAESQRLMAEALAENSNLVLAEKMIEMIPKFAREVAQPMTQIESVKIVDMGDGDGVSSFGNSVTKSMLGMQEPLKELTGLDIKELLTSLSTRGNTHTSVIVPEGSISPKINEEKKSTEEVQNQQVDANVEKFNEDELLD